MACLSAAERCLPGASSSRRDGRCCAAPAAIVARRPPPCAGHFQRPLATTRAYVPALGDERRVSLDPMAATWQSTSWETGQLLTVTSPQQFDELVDAHPDRLIVLMCKSHSCRPCKMFTRKYLAIAQRFPEVVCCELYGDETPDTRKMMIRLQVKVTPTFRMYRERECVDVVTGTNDKKLMRGILANLLPAELANHEREISDTVEEEEQQEQQQQQLATAAAAAAAGQ